MVVRASPAYKIFHVYHDVLPLLLYSRETSLDQGCTFFPSKNILAAEPQP